MRKNLSEIERLLFVDLDVVSSWEWSHGFVNREFYNSLSEYLEVRRREFVHKLANKMGMMK